MEFQIEIHEKVLKRLSAAKDPCSGILYGILTKSAYLVLGLELTGNKVVYSLPVGVEHCGYFQIRDELDISSLKKNVMNNSKNSIMIFGALNDKNNINVHVINNGDLEKTDYQIITDEKLYNEYMFVRCKGSFPIKCEFSPLIISEYIERLKQQLNSDDGDSKIVFKYHKNQTFFLNKQVIGMEDGNLKIIDFYKDVHGGGDDSNKKKKVQGFSKPKVLDFDMLWRLTTDGLAKNKTQHAPVCILNKNSFSALDTVSNIDMIAMLPVDSNISDLYPFLVQCVGQFLKLFENCLHELDGNAQEVNFETFHFLPEDMVHFVTVLYLKSQTENILKSYRQSLHKNLLLDQIVPRFRRSNQYLFESDTLSNGPLMNPHEGVKFTDNGGELALVRGRYQYYHYCQNNMDDNGWGCAYRSLQTVASWFKLQGYVDREVPTFHDIQKCLVDIKDKPSSFLGSRQWIGSTEVSFVLNTLLGVECKILFVSSGEDIETKGPELVNHFKTQGSPIMIGGGVLAHTILGVDYNQSMGKLRFLILDPHYTGGEDLHIIQTKGWCGWKGLDFWDKRAYYNMCLPQVPRGV